jgi:hypothetical protein
MTPNCCIANGTHNRAKQAAACKAAATVAIFFPKVIEKYFIKRHFKISNIVGRI